MASNAKLGWATAGAIAWAYLGLLAALGPGVREGKPPLDLQLGHPPGSIVIPGRLLALKEHGGVIELQIGTPSGQPTPVHVVPRGPAPGPLVGGEPEGPASGGLGEGPALPNRLGEPQTAGLPPDVKVEFVRDPGGEPRKPKLQLESEARPFRLPGGGAGILAGNYLLHVTPGEVRLVPRAAIGEKLRERLKNRLTNPRPDRDSGEPPGERRLKRPRPPADGAGQPPGPGGQPPPDGPPGGAPDEPGVF